MRHRKQSSRPVIWWSVGVVVALLFTTALLARAPHWVGGAATKHGLRHLPAAVPSQPPRSPSIPSFLASLHPDLPSATASVYQAHDDAGNGMDALKVIAGPAGGYLGVYHFQRGSVFVSAVAASSDLRRWSFRGIISEHASQPTITALSDGGFLAGVEADNRGLSVPASRWLRLLHFPSLDALVAGSADRNFDAPHTLGGRNAGAEGTPDIESVHLSPTLTRSTVQLSFHYLSGGTDLEAHGTLTDFRRWSTSRDADLDGALFRAGAKGKHGDRDLIVYRARPYQLVEAQDRPGGMWHVYVYDRLAKKTTSVPFHTAAGSRTQANPTITELLLPDGTPGFVVTLYVPKVGAGNHEAGQIVYYQRLDPVNRSAPFIVAAGDIACPPPVPSTSTTCQQAATAQLVGQLKPDTVLALGDLQYENGSLDNFRRSYGPTWGRYLPITHPVFGNHDYSANGQTGYYDYFGKAAGPVQGGYYSFDIGAWHGVALNSECAQVSCAPGSPQDRWLTADLAAHRNDCTMAFWHKPLFTSGQEGPSSDTLPFWTALAGSGADLVVNGHAHSYERFSPQNPGGARDDTGGMTEIVAGTGGKNEEGNARVEPHSLVRIDSTFGVLELLLLPDGFDWHFAPLDAGSKSDSGSRKCH